MKKKLKKVVKNFLKVLKRPEMSILPGHLAFYFLMSLVPIIALAALFASKLTINLDLLSFVNDGSHSIMDGLYMLQMSI